VAAEAAPGLVPARVVEHAGLYRVATSSGPELLAEPSGRLRREAEDASFLPAVGDWVAIRAPEGDGAARIEAILPRRSAFTRRAAGRRLDRQVVAANIDTVFLVSGLDGDFNPRRIERYATAAWDSGARPVVLLNKADIPETAEDLQDRVAEVEDVALGIPVHAVSALTGAGFASLAPYLTPGGTVAFLGSSGVGKSTLVNRLLGREAQATAAVSEWQDRGRHTTTSRSLFVAHAGWLLIDTPGMRELQLWEGEGLAAAFADIEELAAGCAFRDCRHAGEPGCAVTAAVENGELDPARLESYRKLQRELRHVELETDVHARLKEKQRIKALMKAADRFHPRR
jgi:ribosome biogenesis GTPase / thiamine phosphate phosphatase